MKNRFLTCLCSSVVATTGLACDGLPAREEAVTSTEASYARARAAVEASAAALGGTEALAGVATVGFRYQSRAWRRGQSAAPEAAYDGAPARGRFVYEVASDRLWQEFETEFRGGLPLAFERVIVADSGWNYRPSSGELTILTAFDVSLNRALLAGWPPRALPHALVQAALANPATMRWVGETVEDDRRLERVLFADTDGTLVTLSIDAATGLPVRIEGLASDILLGDAVSEIRYADYRPVEGVQVPRTVVFATGGEVLGEWSLADLAINAPIEAELWEPPPGVPVLEWTPRWQPRPVADGVYAVRMWSGNGFSYNTMLVEFDDFVAVVEAPLSDLLYQVVANIVRTVAADKPIRYVIPTHYHFDHTRGLKAYMAAGATVLAPPLTAAFVQELARAPHTLTPNPLSQAGVEPQIEEYTTSTTVSDGQRELVLYEIGPSPHVDEIAIAYLPGEKVLFVSDLFTIPEGGAFGPPDETLRAFARTLDSLGLEIEAVVPGHGAVGSFADMERALSGSAADGEAVAAVQR